jgi:hypothetical protein
VSSSDAAPATDGESGDPGLISVVVVPYAGIDAMRRCLDALASQRDSGAVEIVIPVDDETTTWQALVTHVVRPRIVRAPGRLGPAARRAHGVRESRGAIVAVTEDHCIPDLEWCAAIRQAHAAPHAAIGGPVDKEEPDDVLGWALYFTDYGRYMSPLPEGRTASLTDCNVSYKRSALDAIANVWQSEFHETSVHWALAGRGETLWLAPAMRVHERRSRPISEALRERYIHGRIFAGTRVHEVPLARRAALAVMAPALPAVIAQRAVRHAARGGRALRAAMVLPAIVATGVAWSLGELVGYVTGRGPAQAR